jgi:hypothetical protein
MTTFHTHYDNLQVQPNASDEVIRSAYRALSQKHHPDRNPGRVEECTRIMVVINRAYHVLSDPKLRAEHDVWIENQKAQHGASAPRATPKRPQPSHPQPDAPSSRKSSSAGRPPSSSGAFNQSWKDQGHRRHQANSKAASQSASSPYKPADEPQAGAKPHKSMTLLELLCSCIVVGGFVTYWSPSFHSSYLAHKEWYQLIFDGYYLGLLAGFTGILMGVAVCAWVVFKVIKPTRRAAAAIAVVVTAFCGVVLVEPHDERGAARPQNVAALRPASLPMAQQAHDEAKRRYDETVSELEAQHVELNPDSPSYNPQIVKIILVSKKSYEADGVPSHVAIKKAVDLYYAAAGTAH